MKHKILVIFLVIGLFLFSIYIGYSNYNLIHSFLNRSKELSSIPINDSCSKGLENISNCMVIKVRTFYKYNISNIGKKLSDETLKKEGGVCLNWAEYYSKQALNYGLYSDISHYIYINNTSTHAFAIVSNEEGYCILDQTLKPLCNYLK